jgi:hypothetical protein
MWLTEQGPDNLKITVEKVIEYSYYRSPEGLFGMSRGSSSKDVVIGRVWSIIIEVFRCRVAQCLISYGNLLECQSCISPVFRKLARAKHQICDMENHYHSLRMASSGTRKVCPPESGFVEPGRSGKTKYGIEIIIFEDLIHDGESQGFLFWNALESGVGCGWRWCIWIGGGVGQVLFLVGGNELVLVLVYRQVEVAGRWTEIRCGLGQTVTQGSLPVANA